MAITVQNILDLDIIKEKTELVAGQQGLNKAISYVTIMEAPDFYEWVSGGEFVLTTWFCFSQRPELQVEAFTKLAEKISGLAIKTERFINEIPPEILAIANKANVPVFTISRETKFREIVQAISAELNNFQTNLLMEVDKHYQELSRVALSEGNINVMLSGIGRRGGFPCLCFSRDGQLLGSYRPPRLDMQQFDAMLDNLETILEKQGDYFEYRKIKPFHLFPCTTSQLSMGSLVIISDQPLDEKINLMAQQLATFLTLRLLDRAETEQKILSSLFDDILYKRYLSEKQLQERLSLFGLKASVSFQTVVILTPKHDDIPRNLHLLRQAAYYLRKLLDTSLLIFKADEIVVIIGYPTRINARPLWLKQISDKFHTNNLIISVGPIVRSAAEIETSYRVAKQTAEVARYLDTDVIKFFGDYIQFSLLMRTVNTPEHRYLVQQTIAPLQEEDRRYNNDLVETLTHSVLAKDLPTAAKQLGVHINTVRYRLGKISTLTGYDFFNPSGRYALTSACLLHRFSPE
jgi:purine catabolism regulator